MLEQPRKTGVKVISHMLASHGGEIFIHILPTCRSILEDPPSISEGCGGRVTDYRITVRKNCFCVCLFRGGEGGKYFEGGRVGAGVGEGGWGREEGR